MSRLAKEAVTENWRSRNFGKKVAMPATIHDMHTWDRTTSRKMGWRSVLSSTLGKTDRMRRGGQSQQPDTPSLFVYPALFCS
jgi:hypothetical protein